MLRGVRLGIGLFVGWAGAALWAYGIAVLQPLTEPGSPFWEYAENNSYWARDVRWAAILAVSAVLAAVSRRAWVAAVAVPWLAADLVLDRIDPGRPVLVPAGLTAAAVITAVAIVAVRRSGTRPLPLWIPLACLFTTGLIVWLESPTDSEPQLLPARLAAYAVGATATLVCVLASLTVSTLLRRWPLVAALAVTMALFGAFPALVTPVLLVLCAAAIVLLRRPWPGPGRAAGIVAAHAAGLSLVGFLMVLVMLEAARPFTALAGNEAVNSADSDPSFVLLAVAVAVVWAGLVHLVVKLGATLAEKPATPVRARP